MTARDAMLTRIREAYGEVPPPATIPRDYSRSTPPDVDIAERFAERVADYRATVLRTDQDRLPATIAGALARRGIKRLVVPAGIPDGWLLDPSVLVRDEPPLTHAELDALDGTLTGCAAAIAETGTVVLDAGPDQGRRVLSLLPDYHLCIVRVGQIVGDVPEALARLDPRRPLTWISGPSATSDIELQRVEGVHGPRILDVVIVT